MSNNPFLKSNESNNRFKFLYDDTRESFNAEYLDGFFNNGQDIIKMLAKTGLVQSNNEL